MDSFVKVTNTAIEHFLLANIERHSNLKMIFVIGTVISLVLLLGFNIYV